jgi:ribonucleoside-diphosphate reductase alpha chain
VAISYVKRSTNNMANKAPVDLYHASYRIWDEKYRLKMVDGTIIDCTVEDTWARIASALTEVEDKRDRLLWYNTFYEALEDFKFIPAGRIIAGAGTDRNVTLCNCYVMAPIHDSIEGIFQALKESAITLQSGGGIGIDISTLRPAGAYVKGVEAVASGPLSFADCWDSMCRTMLGAGTRRGAMMLTMRCDHPDIEAFIDVKRDPARLRMFNLSVLVTDAFMTAVRDDLLWDLVFDGKVYKTISASTLWDKIMQSTYDCAEPGVIFIDRINNVNNLYYCETITATNPCGEQPLPPYGACLLGSINLTAFIQKPFTPQASFNYAGMAKVVRVAVRMMDNVIDISKYPLPQQKEEQIYKRRIGLGVVGLADALIMMCLEYGSPEAIEFTEACLGWIEKEAYTASSDLAETKGPFPYYDKEKYLSGAHVRELDFQILEGIRRRGIRNSLLTSIAPTGTISNFAQCISGGLEPLFDLRYTRKMLLADNTTGEMVIEAYSLRKYREYCEAAGLLFPSELPSYFVTAQTLTPRQHVLMQAAVQKYVDSSISKTINTPEDISFEDFKKVYSDAYLLGCKSCTTYRPNEITGSVLTAMSETSADLGLILPASVMGEARKIAREDIDYDDVAEIDMEEAEAALLAQAAEAQGFKELPVVAQRLITEAIDRGMAPVDVHGLPLRPEELEGKTYKVRWTTADGADNAYYITINDDIRSGQRAPFEIFINSKNVDSSAWTIGLTRMISAIFRRGGNLSFVVEELQSVFDPKGGSFIKGKYIPSFLAAVGNVIKYHIDSIQHPSETTIIRTMFPVEERGTLQVTAENPVMIYSTGSSCPKCEYPTLIHQEGCSKCTNCDYSSCE